MSKKPPNRPGIIFEVGARVEAQDYLQKWYPSRIEEIDYDEGKMLVHFDRWSHRYDEWIFWDSNRLRPLERPALRKEGLKEEDDMSVDGEEVLARWTDCRYYPAKIEAVNKEGTYTVQFYDGVIRCVKRIHIKSMPEDAKGQDWIALVKAATTAAKSKGAPRSRTSANSNKDRGGVDEECEEAPVEEKALKPVAPLSATSPARPRNRRLKHDSGESSNSSLKQAGDESESSRSPASAHSLADAAQPVPPCSPQRKRRSQRLANSFEPTCPPSPHNKAPSPSPLPVNTNPSEHEGGNHVVTVSFSKAPSVTSSVFSGKRKEKDKVRKERKEKDPFKLKQKKKKKKKKKSKQHCYSELEDMSMAFMERTSPPPLHRSSSTSAFALLNSSSSSSSKHAAFQYPRAILTVDLTGENLSDVDFVEDSTTESLLLSGDEYNQDLESFAMDEFHYDDEDAANEIVRCICEMDEENGFMIQCEECMCWQHSVCMGLLEDSIPDQYICYICRDPPGQRCNARYWHDKDWLNKGHMYGLSFLTENYSHQNAKKIVSTHQLLGDVYSVKKVLHGLQLKMDILQANHNPSLHLWARSWVNSDEEQPMGGVPDCVHFRDRLCQNTDTYITSEHSYQKPAETLGHTHHRLAEPGVRLDTLTTQRKEDEDDSTICLAGCVNDGSVDQARNCLQWQMNLLTHIEDLQNQVAGRMDLIEKELDVLESWLDFTGELEPPDPLGRLPQLKCRINQLLTDLGKVQQMSTLCSV
uniref:PHD finger protein 20-like protein 1 n=1 Tax=Denticeps clupeoides TaxID=299321 RepID=A0AAY4C9Q5_9TELE